MAPRTDPPGPAEPNPKLVKKSLSLSGSTWDEVHAIAQHYKMEDLAFLRWLIGEGLTEMRLRMAAKKPGAR